MTQQEISKLCADSLRTFSKNNYDIKLKATHAHELVAAYFGYSSKNAMLADSKFPISDINKAEIIVLIPDKEIEYRRQNLQDLSPGLPDGYRLGEAIYASLFSDELWVSQYPPFRGFQKLAEYLVENNFTYQSVFKFYRNVPMHHIVEVNDDDDVVILTVLHSYRSSSDEQMCAGKTTIKLPRVAGRIGFREPHIIVEQWRGGARRALDSFGGNPNV